MIDLSSYFGSLSAMAGLVILITGWVNTHGLNLKGWKAQLLSWGISIALAFVGSWKGVGLFAETSTVWTIVNGLGVGLIANGIFSVDLVKTLLEFLKAKPASK